MRAYDPTTISHAASASGLVAQILLWVEAKGPTGQPAPVGLWTGEDDRSITVAGQSRHYDGAGELLAIEPITYRQGLDVRLHKMVLSGLGGDTEALLTGTDARLAPADLYRVIMDAATREIVGSPHRLIRGWVNELVINTGQISSKVGGQDASKSTVELTLATSARALTRSLALKYADATQQANTPGDGFFRWAALSGQVQFKWG
jgi:hypothetical protein